MSTQPHSFISFHPVHQNKTNKYIKRSFKGSCRTAERVYLNELQFSTNILLIAIITVIVKCPLNFDCSISRLLFYAPPETWSYKFGGVEIYLWSIQVQGILLSLWDFYGTSQINISWFLLHFSLIWFGLVYNCYVTIIIMLGGMT